MAGPHVIAWQWCDTEKTAAWTALLQRIPPPRVVVIDGGAGLASALKACWPTTQIQRCLVHVQRNVRTHLTMRPRTEAGKSLRALSLALTRITTTEQAAHWQGKLHTWHQLYKPLITAKTYLKDTGIRPAGVRANSTWWWTHDRLRKAYRLLERLARQEVLFTYLDPDLEHLILASTTNRIEGGVNAQLRHVLRDHRGMSPDHQRRAIEWWCFLHSPHHKHPTDLIRPEHYQPQPPALPPEAEPIGPAAYDTALNPEEGLWTRKGWAGRTH